MQSFTAQDGDVSFDQRPVEGNAIDDDNFTVLGIVSPLQPSAGRILVI
jgi:hypothetical protein